MLWQCSGIMGQKKEERGQGRLDTGDPGWISDHESAMNKEKEAFGGWGIRAKAPYIREVQMVL